MVELICAPKIHRDQIAHFKIITMEYVHLRQTLFPDHHFSLSITICFIIVTSLCTLGHLFVCGLSDLRVNIHILRNAPGNYTTLFISVTDWQKGTSCFKHTSLSSGSLFPPTVQAVGDASEYDEQLYNALIQECIRKAGFTKETVSEVSTVVYKGTKYRKGLAVVTDHSEHGYVFGKISVILISHKQVHFVLDIRQSVLLIDLGLYCLQSSEKTFACIHANHLCDYYPPPVYKVSGLSVVSLHHSVSSF